jgi:pyruvate dehydrogenase E2 component (dihydrolipoyllysine-residue acetyltransferase)
MPALGADMEAGRLLEWRVKPGDAVKRGEIVAVVDTDKAEIEVEIFEDGVIEELLVEEGTKVPVGAPLAKVTSANGETPAPTPEHVAAAEPTPPPEPPPAPTPADGTKAPLYGGKSSRQPQAPGTPAPSEHHPRVSPLARRTAERLHVDLAEVEGSGPGGSVVQADVERAAGAPAEPAAPVAEAPAAPTPVRPEPPLPPVAPAPPSHQEAMRKAIGALMARSKREIPHYYLEHQIEISRGLAWLEERNRERPVAERLVPAVLLLRAVARATAEMPALNGFWEDGAFRPADGVHLGVAISLRGGGLVAPAIHDADRKGLDQLMAELRDLVSRARGGRLRSSEMADPTITVTNLGEQGADLVQGVIYPPQVALVGFGAIRERPWAADGMVGARPVVTATLAGDHRASDGIVGSRFLSLIDRKLQNPEEEL